MANGSKPEVALTMRRLAAPGIDPHTAALQASRFPPPINLRSVNVLELRFGSELQTIQFMGRVTAFRPFGSADLHLSPNTVVEYRYATSEPDSRVEKGFESAPADLSESGPHMSRGRIFRRRWSGLIIMKSRCRTAWATPICRLRCIPIAWPIRR